jgi:hypothetical protein
MSDRKKRTRHKLVRAMRSALDDTRPSGPETIRRMINILDGLVMLLEFETGLREWKKP